MSRRGLVIVLLLLWLAAFGWSIIGARITPATGDGFARGLNRLSLFLGWQFAALLVAILAFAAGRALEAGLLRRLSMVPLIFAGLLVLAILGVFVYAQVQHLMYPPEPYVPPGPPTAVD